MTENVVSGVLRSRLRAIALEVRDAGDALDLWSRRHAPDPQTQEATAADAARLWTAAAEILTVVGESPGT